MKPSSAGSASLLRACKTGCLDRKSGSAHLGGCWYLIYVGVSQNTGHLSRGHTATFRVIGIRVEGLGFPRLGVAFSGVPR